MCVHFQVVNATQLSNWCLHFISTNFDAFSRRSEFKELTGNNLEHVTKERWPPVSYLKEAENYAKELEKWGETSGKCSVM